MSRTRIRAGSLEICDVNVSQVTRLSLAEVKEYLKQYQKTVQAYTGGEIGKARL